MMNWSCFWYWVSNIGSLASLIALPIALWQMYDVRKKLKFSEESTKRFLNRTNREQLEMIQESLTSEHAKLVSLKTDYKKQGTKWQNTQNQVESIIQELNVCAQRLPTDFTEVEEQLREVMSELTSFLEIETEKRDEIITEAEYQFHDCLDLVKQKLESMKKEELNQILKSE